MARGQCAAIRCSETLTSTTLDLHALPSCSPPHQCCRPHQPVGLCGTLPPGSEPLRFLAPDGMTFFFFFFLFPLFWCAHVCDMFSSWVPCSSHKDEHC